MSSFKIKMILIGEGAVGKTSLVYKFVHNQFKQKYELTVGVDISTKNVQYSPNEVATLSIWDIGGQQRFEFIRTTFYKGAAGALLVFDLTREETYTRVKEWLAEVRQFAGKDIPFLLIGNKVDLLEDVGEVVDREEARALAEKENSIYLETSALSGINVEEAFVELTRRIIDARTLG